MPPEDPDWWFIRAAAVLRRVYVDGPLGVERMRSFYGGKQEPRLETECFPEGQRLGSQKGPPALSRLPGSLRTTRPGAEFSPASMAFLDSIAQEVIAHPPAPVPKRVKPVAEEPKKAEAKKGKAEKSSKAEKSDDAKGEKKPAAKKGEGKKAEGKKPNRN